MYSCKFNNAIFIKVILILTFFWIILSILNSFFISIWSTNYQFTLLKNSAIYSNNFGLSENFFHVINNNKTVLFFERKNNNKLNWIFFTKIYKNDNHYYIITAHNGKIKNVKNTYLKILYLDNGTILYSNKLIKNFKIIKFKKYKIILKNNKIMVDNDLTLSKLLFSDNVLIQKELHWRISLIFSIPIMALLALSCSKIYQREKKILPIFICIFLYFLYFLIQLFFKTVTKNYFFSSNIIWIWIINIFYFLISIILNNTPINLIRKFF